MYICSCSFLLLSTMSPSTTLFSSSVWNLFTCLMRFVFGDPWCLLTTLCPGQYWQIMSFSNSPSRKNFRERNFMISLVVNVLTGPSLTSCNKASIEYTIKWEAFACIVGLGKLGLTLIYVPQSCHSWSASSAYFPSVQAKPGRGWNSPNQSQPNSSQLNNCVNNWKPHIPYWTVQCILCSEYISTPFSPFSLKYRY